MPNILTAFQTLITHPISDLISYYKGKNRINQIGDALEFFIKDIFADTVTETDELKKLLKYDEVFSYSGNANNPPDLMLKNGDAVEIKKIESLGASIALNSSYPKSKLFCDSPLITSHCRTCEDWQEKDIIYAIGVAKDKRLKLLWLIYGDCYAADREIYEKITNTIASGINQIPGVEFSKTKELGRVNKVDPLKITYLRIRGMWGIQNPLSVFDYANLGYEKNSDFQAIAIMKTSKYLSFPAQDREGLEARLDCNLQMFDVKIKSPNNPIQLISARIINYRK
ncbi:restriction endonuclease [Chroococcidiopsis sp. CCALA 051]|uniref:NgoPII family restriction endonuclease n=1 Tax=Chroococcidiopsis sp. CCALA 051 TaxID=869949 RepID=UPI000D0CB28C|nr:NgoPII family restriction endonuclease [Chroococcidiopsis sp. CCALA 051]PSM51148.1 restriction endonuclease [Chroococcidiopsis sp. CCALA 051]